MIHTAAPMPAAGLAPVAGHAFAGAAEIVGESSFSAILEGVGLAAPVPGADAVLPEGGMLFPTAGGNAGKASGKNLPEAAAISPEASTTEATADSAGVSLALAGMLPLPLPPLPGVGPLTLDPPRAAAPKSASSPRATVTAPQPGAAPATAAAAPAVALAPVELVAEPAPDVAARLQARVPAEPGEAVAGPKDKAPAELAPPPAAAPPAAPAPAGMVPLAGVPQAPAPASADPAAVSAPRAPAAEAPQDFATLVSRLAEAREAASPHLVRTAIAHAEFGQISLQFRHEDNALSVTMANSDPAFAGAVQAAAQASAAGSESDRNGHQQPQQHHAASQQAAQGGAGNGGHNQQSRAEQAGASSNRDPGTASRAQDREAREPGRGRDLSRSGGGIYA